MNKGELFKERWYTSVLLTLLWGAFFVSSIIFANTVTISLTILPPVTDTGSNTTGSTNTGTTNTGATNTGATNTGSTNTGATNTGSTNTGSINTGSTNTGSVSQPVNWNNWVITIPTGTVQPITTWTTAPIITGIVQPIDQNTWVHNASTGDWDNDENDSFLPSPSTTIKNTTNPTIPNTVHNSADLTGQNTPIDSEKNSCAPDKETNTSNNQFFEYNTPVVWTLSSIGIFWWMATEIKSFVNIFDFMASRIASLTWHQNEEVLCSTWAESQSISGLSTISTVLSGAVSFAKIDILNPMLHFFAELFHF